MLKKISRFFSPKEKDTPPKARKAWNLASIALLNILLLANPSLSRADNNICDNSPTISEQTSTIAETTQTQLIENLLDTKQNINLEEIIEKAKQQNISIDWMSSIIDILRKLWIDYSFNFRKEILYWILGWEWVYKWSIDQNMWMIQKLNDKLKESSPLEEIKNSDESNNKIKSTSIKIQDLPAIWTKISYLSKTNNKISEGKILEIDNNAEGIKVIIETLNSSWKKTQFAVSYKSMEDLSNHIKLANQPEEELKQDNDLKDTFTFTEKRNQPEEELNQDENLKDNFEFLKIANHSKKAFIDWLAPIVEDVKEEMWMDHFPTSFVIAAWALESWWWKSKSAQKNNNIFWIMTKQSKLKEFETHEDSVRFYIKLLSKSRLYRNFQRALSQKNIPIEKRIPTMAHSLNDIYAQGTTNYATKLIAIIKQNNLLSIDS